MHCSNFVVIHRLVGVGEERRRYFQANCFRSPEVDHELRLRRLHHRQVRRLGTLQNLSGVDALLANGIGSKADMCGARSDVRFTPKSDRESRHPQTVMSALPPKADICSAQDMSALGQ